MVKKIEKKTNPTVIFVSKIYNEWSHDTLPQRKIVVKHTKITYHFAENNVEITKITIPIDETEIYLSKIMIYKAEIIFSA